MKKLVAALSAVVIGGTAAGAAALPAQAATATPSCGHAGQGTVRTGNPAAADFYMTCVPQYGLGKSLNTLDSSSGFSSAFSLTDPTQAVAYTTLPSAAASYLGSPAVGGFDAGISLGISNPTSRSYIMEPIGRVTSVQKITPAELPGTCLLGASHWYGAAYKITYSTSTTVFQTTSDGGVTVSGKPGKFTLTTGPETMYLGLNFTSGTIDITAPQCGATASTTQVAASQSADATAFADVVAAATSLWPAELNTASNLDAPATAQLPSPSVATTLSHATYGYGAIVRIVAKGGSTGVNGTANVRVDGAFVGAAKLVNGVGSIRLSKSLAMGHHSLAISVPGNNVSLPRTVTSTITIGKVATATAAVYKTTVLTGHRAKISAKVKVTTPGTSFGVTGKVAVYVNAKKVATLTLKKGGASYSVTKGKGKVSIKFAYLGTTKLATSSSVTKKITIK